MTGTRTAVHRRHTDPQSRQTPRIVANKAPRARALGHGLIPRTGAMRDDVRTMTVFLVLLIPVLLMVFALFMERVENRLRTRTVSEADVQEFLDTARPEEVNTLIREGWTRAFDKFRLRRRPRFRRRNGTRNGTKNGNKTTPNGTQP